MQKYSFKNLAIGKLNTNINSVVNTFDLEEDYGDGDGSISKPGMSTPTPEEPTILTVIQFNDQSGDIFQARKSKIAKLEMMTTTSRTGDTYENITRGAFGTVATGFDGGSYVFENVTAEIIQAIYDSFNLSEEKDKQHLVYNSGNDSYENKSAYYGIEQTPSIVSGEVSVDASEGNFCFVEVSESITIKNPTNLEHKQYIEFELYFTSSGLVSWDGLYDFGGAVEPALTSVSGAVDIVTFRYSENTGRLQYRGAGLNYNT